jgi:quinol monooxygenase YgiN
MMKTMSLIIIHAEIHGLGGRAEELRTLLAEHAERSSEADGCLGAVASQPLGAEIGEYTLTMRWDGEASLRTHYASNDYTHYVTNIGELLARPSDVTVSYVDREVRATADLSQDPTLQG